MNTTRTTSTSTTSTSTTAPPSPLGSRAARPADSWPAWTDAWWWVPTEPRNPAEADAINRMLAESADDDLDADALDRLHAELLAADASADARAADDADRWADYLEECDRLDAIARINEATAEARDRDALAAGVGTFGHLD